MTYNPLTIRSRFENRTPDRYLSFFEAVQEIMHCETTCKTYKLQKIGILLGAAESGRDCWNAQHNETATFPDRDERSNT